MQCVDGLIHRAPTAALAVFVLVFAFGASAQEREQQTRFGTAESYLQRIPAQAPTDFISAEGQRYAQALPAVGREDMHDKLEGTMRVAGVCGAASVPQASIADHIIALARTTQVVIINEAHDVPRHRAFTRSLVSRLRESGYGYFAAETFMERIGDHPDEAFGRLDAAGSYGSEPTFGSLIRTAKRLGYELVAYEAELSEAVRTAPIVERVARREEGQAENLIERVLERDPEAKVVVHVGYSHAAEVPIPSFGTDMPWMAARLKAKTGIDPLTIDQTYCESPGETTRFADPTGRVPPNTFDLSVAHPATTFERGRPTWRLASGAKLVDLPAGLGERTGRVLVEARFADEPPEAIPVDRLLLWPGESIPLVLPPGDFRISVHEEGGASRDLAVSVDE